MRTFLVIVVALLAAGCRETLSLPDTSGYFLMEDSTKQMTAAQAWDFFKKGKATRITRHSFNPGFTTSYFWLIVKPEVENPSASVLEIGTPQLNKIEFYSIEQGVPVKKFEEGDHYPFWKRNGTSLDFTFPLEKNIAHYVLKIDKVNEALQLTFTIKSKARLQQEEVNSSLMIGVCCGIVVLVLIFATYLYGITRENIYIFYVLFITFNWLYVLANQGYTFQYFWPGSPWFCSRSRPLFSLLASGFSLFFIETYVGPAAFRWLRIVIKTVAYTSFLLCLVVVFPLPDLEMNKFGYFVQVLIPILAFAYVISVLTTVIQKVLTGNKMALFYLTSILPFAVFSILQIVYYSGNTDFSGSYLEHYGQATGIVLEIIILTFGLAYRFNNYRLEREHLLIRVNQQQAKYAKTIITTQESERRKLADQLHDVAGSLLSAAKLNLSSIREKNYIQHAEAQVKLHHAEEAVTNISEMLRNLSHAISPVMLDKVGFRQATEKVVTIFNSSGRIQVELVIVGFERERPELHEKYSVLYGILYELINNIIKHAEATHALVQLVEHEQSIVMMVEDNGKGMAQEAAKKATHGLAAIQSKIHYLNGTLAFDRADPHGLIVIIEIPTNDEKANLGG